MAGGRITTAPSSVQESTSPKKPKTSKPRSTRAEAATASPAAKGRMSRRASNAQVVAKAPSLGLRVWAPSA
jgi:hypothetical protein